MKWLPHARRLAHQVVRPESRWHDAVARVPRHQFVPRWWEQEGHGWVLRTGPDDPDAWLEAAYSDQSLVTQVDTHHADRADTGDVLAGGTPTSSSTLPSLVVRMYRHAMIGDGHQLLVTTGTGYGTALACARLGEEHVTSIDIDEYLVKLAADRLALLGERPRMEVCDITGPLPGEYDRIVATVSVRPVPVSWLKALRTGGRFVTTISGTGLILTADKTADGGAVGRIEWDRAGFMPTRHGDSYDSPADDIWREPPRTRERRSSPAGTRCCTRPTRGTSCRCSSCSFPAFSTARHRTATPARSGCSAPTAHGPAPLQRGFSSRRSYIRAAPGGCGRTWNAFATGSTGRVPCPSTAPGSPSPRTARPPSPAEPGRPRCSHLVRFLLRPEFARLGGSMLILQQVAKSQSLTFHQ
jgi:protein-L-isoaspartate O-methyltransferase